MIAGRGGEGLRKAASFYRARVITLKDEDFSRFELNSSEQGAPVLETGPAGESVKYRVEIVSLTGGRAHVIGHYPTRVEAEQSKRDVAEKLRAFSLDEFNARYEIEREA